MVTPDFLPLIANAMVLLAEINRLWYAAPLIIAISLVYAGTRHEAPAEILGHAVRFGGWVVVFMVVVMTALQIMAWLEPRPALPVWWFAVPIIAAVLFFARSMFRSRAAKKAAETAGGG